MPTTTSTPARHIAAALDTTRRMAGFLADAAAPRCASPASRECTRQGSQAPAPPFRSLSAWRGLSAAQTLHRPIWEQEETNPLADEQMAFLTPAIDMPRGHGRFCPTLTACESVGIRPWRLWDSADVFNEETQVWDLHATVLCPERD